MPNATEDTLNALKAAQQIQKALSTPVAGSSTQGWQQATGLVAYDLSGPAKFLVPVITPLRNMIPRVPGNGGTATNWKAITAINTTQMPLGVPEGGRSGIVTNTVSDYTAPYAGLGLEDKVSWEASYADKGFDDVRARAVENLLRSFFISEEKLILGGNRSLIALGTPVLGTPTAQTSPAGTFASGTAIKIYVVALTFDGFQRASVSGGVVNTVSRTPADGGSADTINAGRSINSTIGTVTPGSNSSSIIASCTAIRGAVAYAWYWGISGSELLGAITTTSSVLITDTAAGTQNITAISGDAVDRSKDATIFDGLLSQCWDSAGNSYYVALPNVVTAATVATNGYTGTALKADNAGGIVQIDTAFKSFWDNYRLSPDLMIVSGQELVNMTQILIKGGSAPLFRFTAPGAGSPGVAGLTLTGGSVIGQYLNKFTMAGGQMVDVMLHPNMPPGTILFYSRSVPYPLSNVGNILQIKARQDYYQLEWPLRKRQYEFGVYCDELLQNYFPPAFGTITNIANGVA